MNAVNRVHQDSGQVEWYTPSPIIEAAREVMGEIDLDPASSAAANETVGADRFYTRDDDGLTQPFYGRVWLNPPFSDAARFVARLVAEYEAGRVREACVITFASLDTEWARRLAAFPRWYPEGRLAYVPGWEERQAAQAALPGLADAATVDLRAVAAAADAPPKASMVTYVGPDDGARTFAETFTRRLGGWVDLPWDFHRREMQRQLREYLGGLGKQEVRRYGVPEF